MDKAPELIWVTNNQGEHRWSSMDSYVDGTEYIRADLASPLGAVAMTEAAKAAIQAHAEKWINHRTVRDGDEYLRGEEVVLHEAVRLLETIPTPDHAALLAAALKRPKVAALRDALRGLMDVTADRYENHGAYMTAKSALADLEGKP